MDMSNAAFVQPILGLFASPQSPFHRPGAVPNQSLSTGLPRRHVGCLMHACTACFGDFPPPTGPILQGGCLIPHPFGCLQLCLHSLFWGFSFLRFFRSPCCSYSAGWVLPPATRLFAWIAYLVLCSCSLLQSTFFSAGQTPTLRTLYSKI
jgi:hypothetical protein